MACPGDGEEDASWKRMDFIQLEIVAVRPLKETTEATNSGFSLSSRVQ